MKFAIVLYVVANLMAFAAAAAQTPDVSTVDKIKSNADFGLFESWTPGVCVRKFSEQVRKALTFYQAGYDLEGRPVIVAEIGRWQLLEWCNHNETTRELVYRYSEHFWCKIHNLTSPIPNTDNRVLLIYDMADFSTSELTSEQVIKFHLYFSALAEKSDSKVAELWLINSNEASANWFELNRPGIGKLHGRFETKGANKEAYLPALSARMDTKYIPPWLGGPSVNWEPVPF